MPDGQVVFEITGDKRKIDAALRDVTGDIEREGKNWDRAAAQAGDSIQDGIAKALKGIAASAAASKVGKALLDFGKDAVQAASDLQEVQNVVDVTFGEAGAAQIEKWAKAAGTQFGLTETQAKRFTSTLGSMMKSAGLAGPEIVNMSTDLAGLAADMASFYNLDFDTAFQKIRSGISGETEPLKQLGINMSVANLEAYALTQGITKAFDQMSQGEQTMLRYQYLMQATADAQGDFARTSDSYANAVRTLETNIDNLKASVGNVLLPIVSEVVAGINDMVGALTTKPTTTVLDDFAAIDLKTEAKLSEIQQTAEEAEALVTMLEELGGKQIASDNLTNFVEKLTGKIDGLDGALSKAKTGDYAGTISEIAGAMAEATGTDAGAWDTLLTAIGDKLPGAVDATLDDSGQTEAFLAAAAEAAEELGGEYPELWAEMLGVLGDDAGEAINALANGAIAAQALEGLANGANTLSPSVATDKWKALLTALSGSGNIDLSGTGKSIEELANALNSNEPGERAAAWESFLDALYSDIDGLSKLTGQDAEGTRAWLDSIKEAAEGLDPNDAEGWAALLGEVRKGLPNLTAKQDWIDILTALKNAGSVDLGSTGQSIEELATALSGSDPDEKARAWEGFLASLYSNIDGLSKLTGQDAEGTRAWLDSIKEAAKGLDPADAAGWAELLGEVRKGLPNLTVKQDWIDVLDALKNTGTVDLSKTGRDIEGLAAALNGEDPGTDRAQAWRELLDALSADVEGLSKLTGTTAEETAAWLATLAEGANALDPNSAEGWNELFTQLKTGLPGLGELGLAGLFSELGGETDDADGYLRALGYSTDEIADKQAAWLEVCRRLVQTIPGLSSIINTETGEVQGGTEAIREYVKAWEEGQTKLALMNALQQKESALSERFADIPGLQLDAALAERRVRQNREKMDAILKKYGFSGERPYDINSVMAGEYGISKEDVAAYNELAKAEVGLEDDAKAATAAYQTQRDALDEAKAALAEYREMVDEMPGEIEEAASATGELTDEMTALEKAANGDETALTDLTNSLAATTQALEAVEAYYSRVQQESEKNIQSVVKGFESIETPAEKARREMKDLSEEFQNLSASEYELTLKQGGYVPSIQNMTDALEDQLAYLNDYQKALDRARERGVSEDVLAYLADGSVESYDYLNALANDSGSIQDLNEAYAAVQDAQDSLAQSLTDTRLAADTEFKALVDAAQAAAQDLDQYGTAEASMANTVKGIADGIAAKIPNVQTQVDALNAVLANLGNVGGLVGGLFGGGFKIDGSHATGLDYVPFDNYLAQLHEGESVLPAEEARIWRSFKNGGAAVANTIDYEAMGGLMRDNIKPGGNVYLDGRIVGQVISQQQGNSLRTLERSGWQK